MSDRKPSILITHSYFLYFDQKELLTARPYPPLAPLTLIAWLRQLLDLQPLFYDVMFDQQPDGLIEKIKLQQPDILIVYDDDFNFLTKMCLTNMRDAIFEVIGAVKKPPLALVHGSDASDQAADYLSRGFDAVVHRNAEKIIVDLLADYLDGKRGPQLLERDGVSYLKSHEVCHRPQIKRNLPMEDAPFPAWDAIDVSPYRHMWRSAHGYFSLNVSTSHGCPYRCNWCAKPLYGRSYKALSAERAAAEFKYLQNEMGADHIWVTDDIFALKPGWIKSFSEEADRLGVTIPYKCQNRADLINEESALYLAKSGCQEVWLGVESGSQKILDAMQKDETIDTIRTANRLLKKNGVEVGFFLQFGYTGEDYQDIRATLRLVRECLPEHIGISVSYPLKDTPFYEKVVSMMGEKKNWRDSGDLELMFTGRYDPQFYRALHRYTHHYFGFFSLFRRQSLHKRLRRLAAQVRHLPGMLVNRLEMQRYLNRASNRPDAIAEDKRAVTT